MSNPRRHVHPSLPSPGGQTDGFVGGEGRGPHDVLPTPLGADILTASRALRRERRRARAGVIAIEVSLAAILSLGAASTIMMLSRL